MDPFTAIMASPTGLYLARGISSVEATPEPTELIEHLVMPLSKAVAMVEQGEITHAPSCVAILLADRRC